MPGQEANRGVHLGLPVLRPPSFPGSVFAVGFVLVSQGCQPEGDDDEQL